MTMHLFLTGEKQVGKSTIVDKVLGRLGAPIGGFRSFGANYTDDGGSDVCIRGAGHDVGVHRLARRGGEQRGFVAFPEVFDTIGVQLLRVDPACGVVVMDELGFMEAKAFAFQKAVMDCLDGDIPVLGVIKPREMPFLDQIRAHPKVQILRVEVDNRDRIAEAIALEGGRFRVTGCL